MKTRSYKVNKITIRSNNGTIQFRYQYKGHRQEFNLGLSWEGEDNHKIAIAKAQEIFNDIYLYDRYDESKDKYKLTTKKIIRKNPDDPYLKEIWDYYCKFKADKVRESSKDYWVRISSTIADFSLSAVDQYFQFLLTNYAITTIDRLFDDLNSAINLYIAHGKYKGINPLTAIARTVEVKRKKTNKSFTVDEVHAILSAFKDNRYCSKKSCYSHDYYYFFVAFRFLTGCRPSEAIALEWGDIFIRENKNYISFNKAFVKNKLEYGTKNGVDLRLFPVNDELKELIDSIPKLHIKLVFPSVKGGYINRSSFSKNYWAKVVKSLVFDGLVREYLPFYDQRHTFSTLLCRSGEVDLQTISNIVGNSVSTLIKNYIAPNQDINLPKLF